MVGDQHTTDRRTVLKTIGGLAVLGGTGVGAARTDSGEYAQELIVGLDQAVEVSTAATSVMARLPADAEIIDRNETLGSMLVGLPDEEGMRTQTEASLSALDTVDYTEDNGNWEALSVPNDPRYSQQYAPESVNAPAAWETTLGSMDVTVGVADNGVDYNHVDLEAQYRSNKGTDPAGDSSDPIARGREAHGTHVTGIASATTDNDVGIAGISNSHLLNARVLAGSSGSFYDIAEGIEWLADNGADVINLSLGGGRTETVKRAVEYAKDAGVTIIAAAGNDGPWNDTVIYPAAFEETIAVSALTARDDIANFSSRGEEVDLAAPGARVYSTMPDDEYGNMSGTSMAAPVVTGVVALGLALDPSLTPEEIRDLLQSTAEDLGLPDTQQGHGKVDAAAFLDAIDDDGSQPTPPQAVIEGPDEATVGETVTYDGSESTDPDGGSIVEYEWTIENETKYGAQISHSFGSAGEQPVDLKVTDDEGLTNSARKTVSVSRDDDDDDPETGVRAIDDETVEAIYDAGEDASFVRLQYSINGGWTRSAFMSELDDAPGFYRATVSGLSDGDEFRYRFSFFDGGFQRTDWDTYQFDGEEDDDGDEDDDDDDDGGDWWDDWWDSF